jgi:very-short-patch-repair endonuclease
VLERENFIVRSLSKLRNKKWELFIVSRIIHLLDDDEIEFVTQQIVKRQDNDSWYFTDLYFPQLGIHLEIDERHHLSQEEKDKKRHRRIIDLTDERIVRISTFDSDGRNLSIDGIRAQVDSFTSLIKREAFEQRRAGRFIPWAMSEEERVKTVLARGYISIEDNIPFRLQTGHLRCFGFSGVSYQRGGWTIPDGTDDWVWFPRLFTHGIWQNKMNGNGTVIYQKALSEKARCQNMKQIKEAMGRKRIPKTIVFAKFEDNLGVKRLNYVGTFIIKPEQSDYCAIRFDRVSIWEKVRPN